jgi:hypothetical protein
MWKVKPFPTKVFKIKPNRKIEDEELKRIKTGKQPNDMDDRWVIFFEDPWLYFHRSWTGRGIYKAHIIQKDGDYCIDEVLVNASQDQYKSDKENELEQFNDILELFLNSRI